MNLDPQTNFGPFAVRIAGWIVAALGGAVLSMLLNFSANQKQVEQNTANIVKVQQQVSSMQVEYATNKRVDDLAAEVRSNYRDLSGKLDNVLKILIERK